MEEAGSKMSVGFLNLSLSFKERDSGPTDMPANSRSHLYSVVVKNGVTIRNRTDNELAQKLEKISELMKLRALKLSLELLTSLTSGRPLMELVVTT